MTRHYIAIVQQEVQDHFGVRFPDLPGCVTAGGTYEEACFYAKRALDFHLTGMIEDGEDLPTPSKIESIRAKPEYREGTAISIAAPDFVSELIRVDFSIPSDLLREIDNAAKNMGISRAGYLIRAARLLVEDPDFQSTRNEAKAP